MIIEVLKVTKAANGADSITIRLTSTTDRDAQGFMLIPQFLPGKGQFEYATFYAERGNEILGVTDDDQGRVETRDGEYPVAHINIFRRK